MNIRHAVVPRLRPRGSTPARLQAAKRALQRERDKLPLFAQQLAVEQDTAEQRIAQADTNCLRYWQAHRELAARQWRQARQMLRQQPFAVCQAILQRWNRSSIPPEAHYFADFVRTQLKRSGVVPPN